MGGLKYWTIKSNSVSMNYLTYNLFLYLDMILKHKGNISKMGGNNLSKFDQRQIIDMLNSRNGSQSQLN